MSSCAHRDYPSPVVPYFLMPLASVDPCHPRIIWSFCTMEADDDDDDDDRSLEADRLLLDAPRGSVL
jgi:hypothetical protein